MVACIALLSAVAVYLYMFYQREPYVDPYSHHYQVHPPNAFLSVLCPSMVLAWSRVSTYQFAVLSRALQPKYYVA